MDFFEEEERALTLTIEAARDQVATDAEDEVARTQLDEHFERVAAVLRDLDVDQVWEAAYDQERRVLVEELVEWVTVLPDHLEVTVVGTPPLAVSYGEVGLKESQIVGVGGAFATFSPRRCVAHRVGCLTKRLAVMAGIMRTRRAGVSSWNSKGTTLCWGGLVGILANHGG